VPFAGTTAKGARGAADGSVTTTIMNLRRARRMLVHPDVSAFTRQRRRHKDNLAKRGCPRAATASTYGHPHGVTIFQFLRTETQPWVLRSAASGAPPISQDQVDRPADHALWNHRAQGDTRHPARSNCPIENRFGSTSRPNDTPARPRGDGGIPELKRVVVPLPRTTQIPHRTLTSEHWMKRSSGSFPNRNGTG